MSEFGLGTDEADGREVPAGSGAVAIIGMSCLFPGAPDVDAYWRNILTKTDAVTDPPPESWHNDRYFDPESNESDRIYCKRGGFLGPLLSFDPLAHGIPPVAVGGEPDQWIALQLAVDAMADAGYSQPEERVRKRTAVILGKGTYLNGGNAMAVQHGLIVGQTLSILKSLHPEYTDAQLETLRRELKKTLPPLGPETVPGLIPNVVVGRIANRLDLMGPSYTVDAACASSLVAVQMALRDLANGECDMALVGGSQVWIPTPTMNIFCQLGALSRRQQIRPFDKEADGTLLGEGIGMVVLKRLADAERDGDRVYAVIRGVGVASDGRGVSVMAPRVEGEELALRRAYKAAGVSPRSVGLIEAHGTGTPVGDVVEIQALTRVFGSRGGALPWCALGTVKSMISHTIPASGVAGLIKTALALHHKVLPPTLNCTEPNPKLELEKTPFYLNTETRPWVHARREPRRAGVNSFGFGGINAHAVLEEYVPGAVGERDGGVDGSGQSAGRRTTVAVGRPDHRPDWESEVCILGADSAGQLLEEVRRLEDVLKSGLAAGPGSVRLKDLAFTLAGELMGSGRETGFRLAVVASSVADLSEKLGRAAVRLAAPGCRRIREVSGIYYEAEPLGREGKLAYLFPGEGAQYPNMLADLCLHFPEVRECFDKADRAYADHPRGYVPSDLIFPRPTLTGQENWAEGRLWSMDGAIEAVLAADLALLSVLEGLGVRPGAVVGHSSGEYAALRAAGLLDLRTEEQWAWFARELNRDYELAASSEGVPRAVLLAVGASRERAEAVAREAGGEIHVAMDNCPHQVVLAGERGVIERATEIARREGLIAERLPFDRPYHTPMFAPFAAHLRQVIDQLPLVPREFPLYSCTTVAPFPDEPADIRALLIDHWLRPVEFRRTIETLYAEGVRVFVEVGPRGNLTAFVEDILRGRPFCAVPADTPRRSGITQLNHLVGLLTVQGVDMDLGYPHRWRNSRPIVWDDVARGPAPSRPGVRLKLEAGFPEMRLSADAVREVRAAAPAQVPRHQPAQTSPPPNAEFAAVASTPAGSVSSRKSEPTPSAPAGLASGADDQPSVPAVVDEPVVSGSAGLVGGPRGFVGEMPSAIGSYFQTMERFLGLQQRVIRGCLDPDARVAEVAASNGFQDVNPRTLGQGDGGRDGSGAAGAVPDTDYPLLGAIESWTPGVGLVARRTFDLGEDRYLNDHTLGRDVSVADPDLSGLAIMPMTMSLEVLAEAASALIPGRTVTGLRDVRASRWIAFEDGPQTLEVTARLGQENGDEVAVQLRNLTEDRQGGAPSRSPVIEATVVFSGSYPQPSGRVPLLLKGGRPPRLSQESLYRDHMFHGPSWQGVAGIERINETGVVASLRVLPFDGYLRSDPDPSFVLDPAVLDAAGQVIGFWSVEQLDGGKVIFPFRLESLEIFGPRLPVGDALTCAASIRLVGDQLIRSDIDVLDAGGHPWMRLVGWEDKRFDLPDTLTPLILPSRLVGISEPWPELVAHFPRPELFRCRWVRADFPSDRGFWKRVWANRMLSRAERELFRRLSAPESRQLEWLAGRAAAKEAVRQLLGDHHGLDVPLVDIEILPDAWGRPRVDGAWRESVPVLPVVSISHTDGLAVAAAGLAESAGSEGLLGIDVEFLHPRPPGFAEAAFDAEELEILHGLPPDLHEEWVLRAWCAKEAVGKAMGRGLVEGPRSVRVAGVDTLSESVLVQPSGRSIAALPNPAFSPDFVVSTGRYGDLVVATTHRDPLDSVLTGIEVSPTVPPHTPGALHPAGKENQR